MKQFLFILLLLLPFSAARAQYWVQCGGSTTVDEGMDVDADATNNSYSTGYFTTVLSVDGNTVSSAGIDDIYILKTSPTGVVQWLKRAGGPNSDKGLGIDADGSGNIAVTGFFYSTANFDGTPVTSAGQQDIFIAKYNAAGTLAWVVRAGGTGSDVGNAVTFDNAGNVIVTGEFSGSCTFGSTTLTSMNGSIDIFTAKYDPNGNLLWVKQGTAKYTDRGTGVAVDNTGSIYVSGMFSDTITFDNTYNNPMYNAMFVVKYNPSGQEQWFRWMGSGTVVNMGGIGVVNHQVTFTGNFSGTLYFFGGSGNPTLASSHNYNIFLARTDSLGNIVWTHADGSDDEVTAEAVEVLPSGESMVAGNFKCRMSDFSAAYGSGIFCSVGFHDTYVSHYSNSGTWDWARQYGGRREDMAFGMVVLGNGRAVVTGSYEAEFMIPGNSSNTTYHGQANDYYYYNGFTNYCSDSRYFDYVQYFSHGNKDIFLNSEIDPARQPYDYFERLTGSCSRPYNDICIRLSPGGISCQDTLSACGTSNLGVDLNINTTFGPYYSYTWNTGSLSNTIAASTTGNYSVTVTSFDGCFTNSDTVYYISHPIPVVPLVTDSKGINTNALLPQNIPLCLPDTVQLFCPNAAGYSVQWNGHAVNQNPIITSTAGYYTVTLTNSFGCTSTNTVRVITGNALPVVDPRLKCLDDPDRNDSITLCLGQPFRMLPYDTLSNPTASLICFPAMHHAIWNVVPSGSISYSSNQTCNPNPYNYFYPTTVGDFDYTISVMIHRENPCDTDSIFIQRHLHVTVNPVPTGTLTISVSGTQYICPGDTVLLVATPSTYNIYWTGGVNNDSLLVTTPGYYTASASVSLTNAFGCSNVISGSSTFQVMSYPQPTVTMLPSSGLICPNDSVRLTCSGTGTYQWQGPNGNAGTTQSIYVTTPGYYYCILTTSGCPLVSNTVQVIQYNIPLIVAFPQPSLCGNDTVQLTVITNPGSIIMWQPPLAGSSPVQVIRNAGVYSCNVLSCSIVTPLSFTVYIDSADAAITASDTSLSFCQGDSILLTANPGMTTYLWLPGVQSANQIYATTGGTHYLYTTSQHGCTDSASITLTVTPNPLPPPQVQDTLWCAGLGANLYAVAMDTVTWSRTVTFDTLLYIGNPFPTGRLFANTHYYVRSVSGSCKSTIDSVDITIDEHCHDFFLPNVITPNDDGKNDFFPGESGYYELDIKIYNRWGKVIYDGAGTLYGWDGRNNSGELCAEGTYFFALTARFYDGFVTSHHGTLMLLR